MINPEDEIVIDLRTSCTKDEAVAKLLGWMQGNIRRKFIEITEHGIPAEQLQHLHLLGDSLQDQLVELREAARQQLIKAAESGGDISEAYENVERCDERIRKAASYLLDIDDEISKGETSSLRIDHQATNSSGKIHITLVSLDQWARKQYGIPIIETSKSNIGNANSPSQSESEQQEDVADSGKGLSKTMADNLYTSFAFLIEAFADTAHKYGHCDKPNVSAIAGRIEALAQKANKNDKLSSQSQQSIQDRIEEAMRIKKKNFL